MSTAYEDIQAFCRSEAGVSDGTYTENMIQAAQEITGLKLNGTALNFRLADDSADAAITAAGATLSGVLKLGNAYVATPQVTSGYVTIQDSTGTTYKVCVAT